MHNIKSMRNTKKKKITKNHVVFDMMRKINAFTWVKCVGPLSLLPGEKPDAHIDDRRRNEFIGLTSENEILEVYASRIDEDFV